MRGEGDLLLSKLKGGGASSPRTLILQIVNCNKRYLSSNYLQTLYWKQLTRKVNFNLWIYLKNITDILCLKLTIIVRGE